MSDRHFPQLNITLPKAMIKQLAIQQKKQGLSRSAIIQFAIRDWLAKQSSEIPDDRPSFVGGILFDKDKDTRYYMKLAPDYDYIKLLDEFEAAWRRGH